MDMLVLGSLMEDHMQLVLLQQPTTDRHTYLHPLTRMGIFWFLGTTILFNSLFHLIFPLIFLAISTSRCEKKVAL